MRAVLVRLMDNGIQTLGRLFVFDGVEQIFSCYTLELAWHNNDINESCIPPGVYTLQSRNSKRFGDHLAVTGVPDRTAILVHTGNYNTDTSGCILVGDKVADLNGDGQQDVTSSRTTLKALLLVLQTPCNLHVVEV